MVVTCTFCGKEADREDVQEFREIVLAVQVLSASEDSKENFREVVQEFSEIDQAVQVISAAGGG